MKIQNVNSQDNNDYYEVLVICKNEAELDKAWDSLLEEGLSVDNSEELELSVTIESFEYETKQDFIKDVRKIAKKK